MQYQKLTGEQRRIRAARLRRNHIVCELMAKDKSLTSREALSMAYRLMRKGRKRK